MEALIHAEESFVLHLVCIRLCKHLIFAKSKTKLQIKNTDLARKL